MPLKTEFVEEPTLNLTPMLDVVLLLIIFFMVGTRFSELERQYDIQLPSASAATPLTGRPDEIVVNVAVDGTITIDEQTHSPDSLRQLLAGAHENYPQQVILIRGDRRGPFQHVMNVLDTARQVGLINISLANQPRSEVEPAAP